MNNLVVKRHGDWYEVHVPYTNRWYVVERYLRNDWVVIPDFAFNLPTAQRQKHQETFLTFTAAKEHIASINGV